MQGQPKIVLKVNDFEELEKIETAADAKGINTKAICDAGRTQVNQKNPFEKPKKTFEKIFYQFSLCPTLDRWSPAPSQYVQSDQISVI
jgi:hypothetical protein